ncbi:MAG: hypothetical protein ACOZAJ_04425, partial [Patescibacteria group bacterium]
QPLTLWECWFYLWVENKSTITQPGLSDVLIVLTNLKTVGLVDSSRGFWFLTGRVNLIQQRLQKNRWSIIKRRRAILGASLLAKLPFVRLIALVNTMSWDGPQQDSDIDFFIIAKSERLFTVRWLVSLVIHLIGWRRHGYKINNRLCLSFYVSQAGQNLLPLSYTDDPYLRFWLLAAQPIYDDSNSYLKFISQNNQLIKDFPNSQKVLEQLSFSIKPKFEIIKKSGEFLLAGFWGNYMEGWFKRIQIFYMDKLGRGRFSRRGDGSTAVVVSDVVLKFHESDSRLYLSKLFRQRLAELLSHVIVSEAKSGTRS